MNLISSKKHSILIVDDEESIRRSLKEILEDCGYNIFLAKDGSEALMLLKHHDGEIDIVLLDLKMPKMDGFEFLQRLTLYITHAVGVIVITGHEKWNHQFFDSENNDKILRCDFLTKPPELGNLTSSIDSAIERVNERREKLNQEWQRKIFHTLSEINLNYINSNKLNDEILRTLTQVSSELKKSNSFESFLKKIGSDILSMLILGLAILALFYLGLDDFLKSMISTLQK